MTWLEASSIDLDWTASPKAIIICRRTEKTGGQESALEGLGHLGLGKIEETKAETTINKKPTMGGESGIETKDTIGSEGLQHNVEIAFALASIAPVHEVVRQTGMDVVHGVDKERSEDFSGITGDHGTNESLG